MRQVIKDIMGCVHCSEHDAEEIEQLISLENRLDWSECTEEEFKNAAAEFAIKLSQKRIDALKRRARLLIRSLKEDHGLSDTVIRRLLLDDLS